MGAVTYVGAGAEAGAVSGADPTPGYPSGILADDILLLVASCGVNTDHATNAVSGFTRRLVNDCGGTQPHQALFYRRATGSESGTVTVTNPGGNSAARIFAYRGIDWAQPFGSGAADDAIYSSSSTAASYPVPSQTPDVEGCAAFLHAVANVSTGSFNTLASHTEVWDTTVGGTTSKNGVQHRLNLPVSATGIRSIAHASGTPKGCAFGVILRPLSEVEGWGVPV